MVTTQLEPDDGGAAPAGSTALGRIGLRGRLLWSILLVAVVALGVGLFGVQRMGALSDRAQAVHTEGAVPLDGLRVLQKDWWQFTALSARSSVSGLPAATIDGYREAARAAGEEMVAQRERVGHALPGRGVQW